MTDTERLDWLESIHTLHMSVEFTYVVDGYEAQMQYDSNPLGPVFHSKTIREVIDKVITTSEYTAEWYKDRHKGSSS